MEQSSQAASYLLSMFTHCCCTEHAPDIPVHNFHNVSFHSHTLCEHCCDRMIEKEEHRREAS